MVRSREPSLTLGTRLGPDKCPVIQTFLILVILFLNGCILISINPTNSQTLRFCKGQCALSYYVGLVLIVTIFRDSNPGSLRLKLVGNRV